MAAQIMVANTYDRHLNISGWFADFRAELPDSSFYLHVVLKSGKEKKRMSNRIWLQGLFNLSRKNAANTFKRVLKNLTL